MTMATNDSFPLMIGLAGDPGSGKDTAGAYLVDIYRYKRIAFGDGVREEVAAMIAWANDNAFPQSPWKPDDVYAKPTDPRMRILLQWWGTEFRREQDPDYWVKKAIAKMRAGEGYVFTDVRFPNEAETVRRDGGVVWKIVGRGKPEGLEGHISNNLDWLRPDAIIDNSGRLDDLFYHIDEALATASLASRELCAQ